MTKQEPTWAHRHDNPSEGEHTQKLIYLQTFRLEESGDPAANVQDNQSYKDVSSSNIH